ncbi:MAG: hypothetical protein F9K23_18285 [Bacteroidetes bacterium]|nr:MAG: hypothetical protein F9K23_18285 [Bacteroidota bacterium]
MQIKSVYKNVFLTVLLTRIIRKELTRNRKNFTRTHLGRVLKERGFEPATRTIWDFLTNDIENVKLAFTESSDKNIGSIDILFTLVQSNLVGMNWHEFEKIQREQIKHFPDIQEIVTQFDTLEIVNAVKTVLGGQEKHGRTLSSLLNPDNYEKVPNNEKLLLKDVLKHFKDRINLRLEQLYPKEYSIGSYLLSEDEIALISFFQSLPQGLAANVNFDQLATTDSFYLINCTPALIIQRLLEKTLLIRQENGKLVLADPCWKFNLPDVKVNYQPLFWCIADQLMVTGYNFHKGIALYFYQKAGRWEETRECLRYRGKLKKTGFLHLYIDVLNTQIDSRYFLSMLPYDPEFIWLYWSLSSTYNSIGDLTNASYTLAKLFKAIKRRFLEKQQFIVEGIEVVIKAFQLGLDILINYDDKNLLKEEAEVFKLFILDFLSDKVLKEHISTERLCQLSSTVAKYYYKIDGGNYAARLMFSAFDSFIPSTKSSTTALINLTLIDIADPYLPYPQLITWAKTAKKVFYNNHNYTGLAKAELYLASLRILNDEPVTTEYLKRPIRILINSGGYDEQVLKHLKNICTHIEVGDFLELVLTEIKRLESIKNSFSAGTAMAPRLTLLLLDFNSRNYDLLGFLNESEALGILLSMQSPTFKKTVSLKNNKELQALISGDDITKMRYLKKARALSANNPAHFYQIPLTKTILTSSWGINTLPQVLNRYFAHERVQEIAKLPDPKFRLDYTHFLIRNKKLNRAKVILDGFNLTNDYPEYYNLLGHYNKYTNTHAQTTNIVVGYYSQAVTLAEQLIKKTRDNKLQLKFTKDKGRYLNNLGGYIIENRIYNSFGKAKRHLIESITIMGSYGEFPYPYQYLALLYFIKYARLSNNKKTKLINRLLGQFNISNDDKTDINRFARERWLELLNS